MHSQIIKNEAGFAFVEAKRAELERKIYLKNKEENNKKNKKALKTNNPKQNNYLNDSESRTSNIEKIEIIKNERISNKEEELLTFGQNDIENEIKKSNGLQSYIQQKLENSSDKNNQIQNEIQIKMVKSRLSSNSLIKDNEFPKANILRIGIEEDENENENENKANSQISNDRSNSRAKINTSNVDHNSEISDNSRILKKSNFKVENPLFQITQPKIDFMSFNESSNNYATDEKKDEHAYELKSLLADTKKCMEELKSMYNERGNSNKNEKLEGNARTQLSKKYSGQTLEYSESDKPLSFENISSLREQFSKFDENRDSPRFEERNEEIDEALFKKHNYSLPQSRYNWNQIEKVPNYSNENFLKNSTNLYVINEDRFINEPTDNEYWNTKAYDFSHKKYSDNSSNYDYGSEIEGNLRYERTSKADDEDNSSYKEIDDDYTEDDNSMEKGDFDPDDSRNFRRDFHYNVNDYGNGELEMERPRELSKSNSDNNEFEESRNNYQIENYSAVMTFGENQLLYPKNLQDFTAEEERNKNEDSVKIENSNYYENPSSYGLSSNVIHDDFSYTLNSKDKRPKWGVIKTNQLKPDISTEGREIIDEGKIRNEEPKNSRKKWDSIKRDNFFGNSSIKSIKNDDDNQIQIKNKEENSSIKSLKKDDDNQIQIKNEEEKEKNTLIKENSDPMEESATVQFKYEIPIDSPKSHAKKQRLFQNFLHKKKSENKERLSLREKRSPKSERERTPKKEIKEMTFKPREEFKVETIKEKVKDKEGNSGKRPVSRTRTPNKVSKSPNARESFKEPFPPSRKPFTGPSNKKTIINAIKSVCFAGEHLRKERESALSKLESSLSSNFLIIFKSQLARNVSLFLFRNAKAFMNSIMPLEKPVNSLGFLISPKALIQRT